MPCVYQRETHPNMAFPTDETFDLTTAHGGAPEE